MYECVGVCMRACVVEGAGADRVKIRGSFPEDIQA